MDEDSRVLLNQVLRNEAEHLRFLQDKRTEHLNGRWWPGQMWLINLRIWRAEQRVSLMRIWMG